MSNKLVNDIRKLPIDSTPKMLLWVLADIADDDGKTTWYAPRSRLMEETGYSNKTVAACISYLAACGILQVIRNNGSQSQYILTPSKFDSSVKYSPKKTPKPVSEVHRSTSELGSPLPVNLAPQPVNLTDKTSELGSPYPSYPSISPIYPSLDDSCESPKSEPKEKRISKKQAAVLKLVELGCDEQIASDWMESRKGSPLTDTVMNNLRSEASKASISIAQAVAWSAGKGYQGFKAAWYQKDTSVAQASGGYVSAATKTEQEQNRWNEFFKEQLGRDSGDNVIDVFDPKKSQRIEGVGHA